MGESMKRRRRVQSTLSDDAQRVLEELAEALDVAVGTLAGEIIEAGLPAFRVTLEALRKAKEAPREAERLLAEFAEQSVMELSQSQLQLGETIAAKEQEKAQGQLSLNKPKKVDFRSIEGRRLKRRLRGAT